MWLSGSDLSPVKCQRQQAVGYKLRTVGKVLTRSQLVGLLTVAGEVCELEITHVRRVTTLCNGDNVVNGRTQRVGEFKAEVHGLAADTAYLLRGEYFLLVAVELRPLSTVVVGA